MPSAEARVRGAVLVALVGLGGLIGGCASTQTTAARVRLEDSRQVAAQSPTVVGSGAGPVRVRDVVVVPAADARRLGAVVVTLENDGGHPLSDLPISVGYQLGMRRVNLNASASLDYFNSHLGLISAHATTTWVFTTSARWPRGAHAFARVGARPSVNPGPIGAVPALAVRLVRRSADAVEVAVDNRSAIPQAEVPVEVWSRRGGRIVCAGATIASTIDPSSIKTVKIELAGGRPGPRLTIAATPTTFR